MNQKAVWMGAAGIALSAMLTVAWLMRSPWQRSERMPAPEAMEPFVAQAPGDHRTANVPPTGGSAVVHPTPIPPSPKDAPKDGWSPPPVGESKQPRRNDGEVDQAASDKWTRHFAEALDELEIDGALDGLHCTKSLCRIDFHFASMGEAMRFQNAAGMPERRRGIEITTTEGRVDVEILMAQEDSPKPEP